MAAVRTRVCAIISGASAWPHLQSLEDMPACANAAKGVLDYLTSRRGLGLRKSSQILNLFDRKISSVDVLSRIRSFVAEQAQAGARDLIFYYVGHGCFSAQREYFLALSSTQQEFSAITGIRPIDLASSLEPGRFLRRYIILDCCFSAAAQLGFLGGAAEAAIEQLHQEIIEHRGLFMGATLERAFPEVSDSDVEATERGTALLCSSGAKDPSRAPVGEEMPMFTEGLLAALHTGSTNASQRLSLNDIGELTRRYIRTKYEDEAVRPEVHAPSHKYGNVARFPFFPNPAYRRAEPAPVVGLREADSIAIVSAIRELEVFDYTRETIDEGGVLCFYQNQSRRDWVGCTERQFYCLKEDNSGVRLLWALTNDEVWGGEDPLPDVAVRDDSTGDKSTGLLDFTSSQKDYRFSRRLMPKPEKVLRELVRARMVPASPTLAHEEREKLGAAALKTADMPLLPMVKTFEEFLKSVGAMPLSDNARKKLSPESTAKSTPWTTT